MGRSAAPPGRWASKPYQVFCTCWHWGLQGNRAWPGPFLLRYPFGALLRTCLRLSGTAGCGSAHSLGRLRPWGWAGAEQQRVTGGSVAGSVLRIRTASHVTCHYFFSPCYSFQGPSSREEHPLGCMLNVQNRKRKGLAENVSRDHFSFHGGAQASIFIPNKAGRGQVGTSLERS